MGMKNKNGKLTNSHDEDKNDDPSSKPQDNSSQTDSMTNLVKSAIECLNNTGAAISMKNDVQNIADSFISFKPVIPDSMQQLNDQIANSVGYNPNQLFENDDFDEGIQDMSSFISPDMMRTPWHQLIILGNGFDLQCGLKSRFDNFFTSREEQLQEIISKTDDNYIEKSTAISKAGLTSWDLILFYYKQSLPKSEQQRWCDIETIIKDVVTNNNETTNINTCKNILAEMLKIYHETGFDNFLSKIYDGSYNQNCVPKNNFSVAEYIYATTTDFNINQYNISDLLNFLINDLHKLENDFSIYLNNEIDSNLQYKEKCSSYFSKIFFDKLPSENDFELEHSVLDFNYTKPYWYSKLSNEDIDVVNIHGRVDGDIIFGIDGKDYMDDESIVPFTKTYRILFAQKVPNKQLFYTSNGIYRTETDIIKFYGHSLNEADYSYFQAIFDGVDLYGGKTELVFYYPSDNEDMRRSLANKVTKLMSDYGKTFDNVDHGKNLLHKLLVEGRLSICSILFS